MTPRPASASRGRSTVPLTGPSPSNNEDASAKLNRAIRASLSLAVTRSRGGLRAVATGDGGSHFQRHHRYPGTHPLTRARFFALAGRAGGRAGPTRSPKAARPE